MESSVPPLYWFIAHQLNGSKLISHALWLEKPPETDTNALLWPRKMPSYQASDPITTEQRRRREWCGEES